ncbi:tail fiber assembly protein (plasmid) [Pseudomonas yamanorum]|nr:tail fiber assembly protein [Pseudomonas yamanorum]
MILYSKSTGGFYDPAENTFVPQDAIEISDEDHLSLLEGQTTGKLITANKKGYPVLVDPPPLSQEVLTANERDWRSQQLTLTDGVVTRHRDELEEDVKTTLTSKQYTDLQAYRRALRNWPEAGEFPLIEHRPVAPTWLAEQSM